MASTSPSTLVEIAIPISPRTENSTVTQFQSLDKIAPTQHDTSQSPTKVSSTGTKNTAASVTLSTNDNEAELNNAPVVLSAEQTVMTSDLEASFDGLFIITPPLSPKTKPPPFFQRSEVPRDAFPVRKYTLPKPVDDITGLIGMMGDAKLGPPIAEKRTGVNIRRTMAKLAKRIRISPIPRSNPFPGVNIEFGWNRARCALDDSVYPPEPSHLIWPEEKMRVRERFNDYSFVAQMKPIQLDEEFGDLVDKIFIGNGSMGRKPGTWWAARKSLFRDWHGKLFMKHVMLNFLIIGERVVEWKKASLEIVPNRLKRKAEEVSEMEGRDRVDRKLKTPRPALETVMSDEWRARRRYQEKKAGRWTDGTLRMHSIWDQFYWS